MKAPREQVFQAWTDYQVWPVFSRLYSRVKVLERIGNVARMETDVRVRHGHLVGIDHPRGRMAKRSEQHVIAPPQQVEVTADTEGAISSSVWKFEPIADGTMVTADVYAPVRGLTILVGTLARRELQSLLEKELHAFATHVEAMQSNWRSGSASLS